MPLPPPPPPTRRPDVHRLGILIALACGALTGALCLVVIAVIDALSLCLGFAVASDCPPNALFDEPEAYPFYLAALAMTLGFAVWFVIYFRRGRTNRPVSRRDG